MWAGAKVKPTVKLMPLEELSCAAECMKVLAHPVRLRVVEVLSQGRFTVGQVAALCGVSPARACEHLRLMKGHGMLAADREGQKVYYRIVSPRLPGLLACVRKNCAKK